MSLNEAALWWDRHLQREAAKEPKIIYKANVTFTDGALPYSRPEAPPRFLGDNGSWQCECGTVNHELRRKCRQCKKERPT